MNSFYSQQAGCTVRWHDLPGSGDPVVFIHGLGCASSYEYPRVVRDPLFGARRAILIDLPGSGYSDKPEHYSYKTTDQAHVVAELIDHLKLDSFWLYGHSMGGSIAIETAAREGADGVRTQFSRGWGHVQPVNRGAKRATVSGSGLRRHAQRRKNGVGRVPAEQCGLCRLARCIQPGGRR